MHLQLILGFGNRLLERIPEESRRHLMPYNHVRVDYRDRDIVLRFSSLLKEKGPGGTLYFSRRRPMAEFGGRQRTIAFSRHVVERICERINPRYIQYAAAGGAVFWVFRHASLGKLDCQGRERRVGKMPQPLISLVAL